MFPAEIDYPYFIQLISTLLVTVSEEHQFRRAPDKVAEAHTSSSGTYFQSILGIFKYHAEVTPVN